MSEQRGRQLRIYVVEQVSIEALQTALSDERLVWAFASRMEDTGLGWLRDMLDERPLGAPPAARRPGVPMSRWEEGRAFGPNLEVDWWREGEIYRLRALLEEGSPPADVDWGEPVGGPLSASGDERYELLHGELDKDSSGDLPTWSEARIPRRLAHPYEAPQGREPASRVSLVVQDYARDGAVVLTRLLRVTSAQE